jgi:N4-gp56 family major capsid protein
MPTNIPYGSAQANNVQSIGLFASCTNRLSTINRLVGKFPKQSDAESKLKNQTSADMPIVRCMDLTRKAGDEVTFDLVNHIGGKPIMGGRTAEGKGVAMSMDTDSLRINQTRKPISAGDTMTQQRTPHQLRKLARALGTGYMQRLDDQLALVHMAGARGFHDNAEWVVPLAADADFSDICVNTIKAPTYNRHYLAAGTSIEHVNAGSNDIGIASTDTFDIDVVDAIRALIDEMPLPPMPCKFEGDEMANDDPVRVLLVSALQYKSFVASTNFRTLQASAMARAAVAKNNPLFRGEAGLWNNILIVKMPKPIRFYADDPINWCASATSETETTTDLVPASFSTTHAVDRALLLGGQALGEALGKHTKSGVPYFWSEKELDHGDEVEVLLGKIGGYSKIRFDVDYQGDGLQPTDHGVIAIDTAVAL